MFKLSKNHEPRHAQFATAVNMTHSMTMSSKTPGAPNLFRFNNQTKGCA